MTELIFSFIAAILTGIFIVLVGIERDIWEFIDNKHVLEETDYYEEDGK